MKEKILNLKKEITRLNDDYEYLTTKKRNLLKELKQEYDKLVKDITKEDLKWIDEEYSTWYANYLHLETVGSIRLPEG
jgi:archaellum component FlaC